MVLPAQLSATGPQPITGLLHLGPELNVSHTGPPGDACGRPTWLAAAPGNFARVRSRRPVASENWPRTVVRPQAQAGHSEMNESSRGADGRLTPVTGGRELAVAGAERAAAAPAAIAPAAIATSSRTVRAPRDEVIGRRGARRRRGSRPR